jgi:hypothetical protein
LHNLKGSMGTNDIMRLLSIEDRGIAEEIKDLLEESEIYTMLVTDNPASSFLNTYFGLNPIESLDLQINKSDYQRAIEILNESPYKDLVSNE